MDNVLTATGVFEPRKTRLLEIIEEAGGQWGIVIEDLDGKGSIHLNPENPFTAASVIKIPIMMAAFREARRGAVRLDDAIILRKEDKVGGSGVLKEFHNGLVITLLDAINLMIVVSDNTATNLVIDAIGKETVNQYMIEKGCTGSRLENYLMRPKPGGPFNTVTAKDITLLLKGLAERTIENRGDCDTMIGILRRQQYNEKIPRYLPREAVCAHKTGEVSGVTHDAGIVTSPKANFVIVCLSQNLEDTRRGVDVIGKVAKWAYDTLSGIS
ncbi:MAG: serine hydrolase [Candidatus Fermentithermobacillus carboniphilus]|uniref:Serine hydrolase n=1 Tax=Candidatus Fermentithermobacillus carboniphilus TaxID=3085328 RepID=A0AAT9LFP5_9FIRM|nr:MAG: serine hydrolase [Candidatus Fermentithermobacillus carboniphilus]